MLPPLVDLLIRHIRSAVVVLLIVTAASIFYLATVGIRFDYSFERFNTADESAVDEYRSFSEAYGRDDETIIVGFEAEDIFAVDVLVDLAAMSDSLAAIAGVERVESLTTHRGLVRSEDGLAFVELLDPLSPETIPEARRRVFRDPLAPGYLISMDGGVTAIYVHTDIDSSRVEQRQAIIDDIERSLKPFRDRYEIRLSGIPVLRAVYIESIRAETILFLFLNSLVIGLLLFWLFGSFGAVLLPLLIVYIGAVLTAAIIAISGSAIDALASTLFAIVLIVGVSDYVHLRSKYDEEVHLKRPRGAALRGMLRQLGAATFLTSITTAIGFATLATSTILPVRRFGVYTAAGVMLAFVISIVAVTATLSSGRLIHVSAWRGPARRIDTLVKWIDRVTARRAGWILIGGLAVLTISVLGATRLRVNSHMMDDLGSDTQLHHDIAFFQDRIASPFPLEIVLSAGRDAFKDPELLHKLHSIQQFVGGLEPVSRSISVVDLITHLDATMNPGSAGVPVDPELIAQYLLLLEMAAGEDADRLVATDHSEARISALVEDVGSKRLDPILARIDSVISSTFSGDPVEARMSGTIVLGYSIGRAIMRALLVSISLAFLIISAIMAIVFRDWRFVVVALIPNVFPLVVTAGLMGFLGIAIKPATAIVFSIAFGIAVDDTIHLLARLRQEIRIHSSVDKALSVSLIRTGRAITMTSLILIGGFAVLGTSRFESSAQMGYLLAFTVLIALLVDLFVVPALVRIWLIRSR